MAQYLTKKLCKSIIFVNSHIQTVIIHIICVLLLVITIKNTFLT